MAEHLLERQKKADRDHTFALLLGELGDPEEAWDFTKDRAESSNNNSERARIYEEFAEIAREQGIFHPKDMRFEKLAAHAEALAKQLRSSEQPISEMPHKSSNASTIKVACSQSQFIFLIGELYRRKLLHSSLLPKINADQDSREIPWTLICEHFEEYDKLSGPKPYNAKTLAGEWSKLDRRNVRGGEEITQLLDEVETAKIVTEGSASASNSVPEPIAGGLRPSRVPKRAREGVRSKPRS